MDSVASFHALADPTRRGIVEALARKPRSVAELAADLPVSRPAVSQHLKVLQDAGLVTFTPAGTRNIYRIDPAGLRAMRAYLDTLWDEALGNLKTLAESTSPHKPTRSKP